ncbi:MAG TPA: hypothetical protein VFY39_09155 [Gammaproteobacteria bacterium]|nr:hypothetical protein [Gammaproteobacteria bacterium]
MIRTCSACALLLAAASLPPAWAHGFAGKRFFPATLSIEDSFVAPELDFLYSHARVPGEEGGGEVDASALSTEIAKPFTRNFPLSLGAAYLRLDPLEGPAVNGWDNFELGAKYQVFIDPDSESALAVGLDADLGGTGSDRVGAESFSTFAPAVFYSKGFGGARADWSRPLAVTAQAAPTFSSNRDEPHTVEWGFTLQYSLPYLEDFVKDTGLGRPLRNMIPLVEVPLETCLDRGCGGQTTGSVDVGIIWVGKYSQVGFELTNPIDSKSSSHVGFLLQYHLYLDDLIPSWSKR